MRKKRLANAAVVFQVVFKIPAIDLEVVEKHFPKRNAAALSLYGHVLSPGAAAHQLGFELVTVVRFVLVPDLVFVAEGRVDEHGFVLDWRHVDKRHADRKAGDKQ
jgi:hypothetical protein